jgi:hypothetical protein
VFPGDADTTRSAVQAVEVLQMLQDDLLHPIVSRGRGPETRAQVVIDLPKETWAALRRSADHDSIGARVVQHQTGLLRAVDVTIGDQDTPEQPFAFQSE